MVRQVTGHGLDDEHEEAADTGEQTHLRHGEGKGVGEQRQQRADEGPVEVAGEVDEGQGEDHPDVGFRPIRHNETMIP
jgi:hypothetical protein